MISNHYFDQNKILFEIHFEFSYSPSKHFRILIVMKLLHFLKTKKLLACFKRIG